MRISRGEKNGIESPSFLGNFFGLLFFLVGHRPGHPLGDSSPPEKEKTAVGKSGEEEKGRKKEEEITMLEFWCVVLFLVLSISTIWLIGALDKMMEGES